jgi:excisionase family DNA binding protein
MALEELHTVAEVAHDLRVDRETVYRRIRRGELDVVRIGRVIRVPVSSLERLHTAAAMTAPRPGAGRRGPAPATVDEDAA